MDEIDSKDDILKNIPMRDDLRKETVYSLGPDAENLLFLGSEIVAYSRGNDIYMDILTDTARHYHYLKGHSKPVQCLRMSPDGKTLLSSSSDGTLRLWNTSDGHPLVTSQQLDTLQQPWYTMLSSARFSPSGNTIWTVDLEGVKVWDGTTLRLRRKEDSDIFYMSMGEISPNGRTMYVPLGEHGYSLYSRKGDSLSIYLPGQVEMMRYSPDGKSLMCSTVRDDERKVHILNISGKVLRKGLIAFTLIGAGEEFPSLDDASFSPDGKALIVADSDGKVSLFNAESGSLLETYYSGESNLSSVGFTANGNSFYAYDRVSGNLHFWGPVVLIW
jgi:WD40 repeat protein